LPQNLLTTKRWSTDIQNWIKLSDESAKFYLSQAESRLQATIETANVITASTDRMIGIVSTLTSFSIGYLFARSDAYLKSVSFFVLLFCAFAGFYLIQNLAKYEIGTLGEEPKLIFTGCISNCRK
jgi:hypothetical protein